MVADDSQRRSPSSSHGSSRSVAPSRASRGSPGPFGRAGSSTRLRHAPAAMARSRARCCRTTQSNERSKICVRSAHDRARAHSPRPHACTTCDDARRAAGRRGRFGVGVLYGSLTHVIGVDLDMLIVLGDGRGFGSPPMGGSRSSVLSNAERVVIDSPFAPPLRADERRSFLAAVASAGKRWLVTPRVGPDRVAHPAPWWSERAEPARGHDRFVRQRDRSADRAGSVVAGA